MEELKEYLLGKGLTRDEANEILQHFDEYISLDQLPIRRVYESIEEVSKTDKNIAAILNTSSINKPCIHGKYHVLNSGRVVEVL